MNWTAARDDTLTLWLEIRRKIPARDSLELLSEINAVCALCEAASEEPANGRTRCERCLAFQQFGGCRGINAEMSERIAAKDWEGLQLLVDRFIESLRDMDLPPQR